MQAAPNENPDRVAGLERGLWTLDRLHELATLTRIADALSHRRDADEVIDDSLDEITHLVGHPDVWIVEARPDGPIGRAHRLDNPRGGCATPLPRPVRTLCQRVVSRCRVRHGRVVVISGHCWLPYEAVVECG